MLAEHYDLLSELPFPAKALDLGCKTGELTKLATFLPTISKVTGYPSPVHIHSSHGQRGEFAALDPAQEMIAVAETFNADSRIEFQVGEPGNLFHFLDKEGYSLVLLMDSDSLLRNPIQTLQTAWEALRPGGWILGYTSAERDDKWEAFADHLAHRGTTTLAEAAAAGADGWRREGPWALVGEPENLVGQVLDKIGFTIHRCTLEDDAYVMSREEALGALEMERGLAELAGEANVGRLVAECSAPFLHSFESLPSGHFVKAQLIVAFLAQKPSL